MNKTYEALNDLCHGYLHKAYSDTTRATDDCFGIEAFFKDGSSIEVAMGLSATVTVWVFSDFNHKEVADEVWIVSVRPASRDVTNVRGWRFHSNGKAEDRMEQQHEQYLLDLLTDANERISSGDFIKVASWQSVEAA
jgi:hypothetical protein